MNKYLKALAVAGLVASVSTGASAADNAIKLELGGHMEQWVGTSDQADVADDYQSSDVQSDTEISVKGEADLRNGLKVGVEVQLEGDAAGVDESFAYVEGNFGRVAIGGVANAVVAGHVTSTDVGLGINGYRASEEVSQHNWVVNSNAGAGLGIESTFAGMDGASKKVVYTSPRVAGLQLGASWAPDVTADNSVQNTAAVTAPLPPFVGTNGTFNDYYAASLNYKKEMSNLNLAASVGYQTVSAEVGSNDDTEIINAGLNVSINNVTVGGSIALAEYDADTEESSVDLGVSFETGPLTLSANYYANVLEATGDGDEEETTIAVAAAYELGAGVEIVGTAGTVEYDDNDATTADNEGEFFVVGTRFAF
ncbi:MAG: porin [Alphaproteobacteria bacterium]